MKFEQLLFDSLHGFGYSLSDSIVQSLWSLELLNSLMYSGMASNTWAGKRQEMGVLCVLILKV